MHADLVEQLAAAESLQVVTCLRDDQRHAGGALLPSGLRGDDQEVAVLPVRYEGLGAVDHVVVAIPPGPCLDAL
jgi:hypothetical protein